MAATNRDLERAVGERGASARISSSASTSSASVLPPLRERREDIPLLTDYFLSKYSVPVPTSRSPAISPETLRLLLAITTGRATCASWRT